jgi:tRNA(Arg) A34 adenosine deaminase TadA
MELKKNLKVTTQREHCILLLFMIVFLWVGCESTGGEADARETKLELPYNSYSQADNPVQQELDEIYTLLAYSLVLKDWQPDSVPRRERRGYNIGTVLVDKDQEVVHWALNCVNSTDNSTEHGEVRAITSYLDSTRIYNLKGFTLYTTLEPCAMCSGMVIMSNVERVVHGQKDVEFSGALDRLALNSEACGGYKPYPRTVVLDASPSSFREDLDAAFQHFLETDEEKYLAKFLTTPAAKEVYEAAHQAFLNYKVKNAENQARYEKALAFLEQIPF